MPEALQAAPPKRERAADVPPAGYEQLQQTVLAQAAQIRQLQEQIEWFRRQLFGTKSERQHVEPDARQLHLGEVLAPPAAVPETRQQVPAHERRRAGSDNARAGEMPASFFDAARVPVLRIEVPNEQAQGREGLDYEIVGHKRSHRLAQRPGAYVVLEYVRPIVKRLDDATLHCPAAPQGVIEGSRADVSFIAGVLVDKFAWHLPLYRQHQRLLDAGFKLSRPWLTQLVQQAAALLEPVYQAQFDSIRASRVKAMDETPIKAGRAGPGKMKAAYFWPVYGGQDEVCFAYFESRRHEHVRQALGASHVQGAVLLSDGYEAYSRYAEKTGIKHAQCWVHCRRGFFEAQRAEPQAAEQALHRIGKLYEIEERIRRDKLEGEAKRIHRLTHSKPLVEEFFAWVDGQLVQQALLPSNPLTKALAYARERRAALEVFLLDPDVPMDTNHLERALRAIPMGRRNWLFCWSELGARHVGVVQSLITTCRLHGVDPYTYFVDVLQRVGQQPAARVAELTPRLWKQHFADNPLRSSLHGLSE